MSRNNNGCVLFADLDRSRSIRAKCSVFSIKIWTAPTDPRKCNFATSSMRERSARSFSPDWIDLVWQDRSRSAKRTQPMWTTTITTPKLAWHRNISLSTRLSVVYVLLRQHYQQLTATRRLTLSASLSGFITVFCTSRVKWRHLLMTLFTMASVILNKSCCL